MEAFIDELTESLCIVMECAEEGDLRERIQKHKQDGTRFAEEEIWKILIQVLRGLGSLHELKIIHRDLKSANIFLFSGLRVKVGDLNVSKVAKQGVSFAQIGSPYYNSPEIWAFQAYDFSTDIWSLGIVLYEMLTLNFPFEAKDNLSLYRQITSGAYPKIKQPYSEELKGIIPKLLQVNPEKRLSCQNLLNLPNIKAKNSDSLSSLPVEYFQQR
eukprot:TRINITY_DN66460_c0_g1_i1.p2 TRINITY_DN66460_c0_g1~~TRINITY_DN66460_c0_g1_i1.p2  ORF type:complete len:214 (+),score=30.22 TRINITY_DN66460_c0_g1_i1:229-870(+)